MSDYSDEELGALKAEIAELKRVNDLQESANILLNSEILRRDKEIAELKALVERLRELLKSLEAIATLASTAEWLDQKYIWQEINKARAAAT
jgi:septal ring factor EnvC (AmiA/AmiB activator)